MISRLKTLLKSRNQPEKVDTTGKIESYIQNGRIPWSDGYREYKFKMLSESIQNDSVLHSFRNEKLAKGYGFGLDERIVEIPWAIDHTKEKPGKLLDAGSSYNYEHIVSHSKIAEKDLTIFTFDPESNNYANKRISYVYGDLRELPFKDNYFDEVASISTIEHIDMDNSIYGWNENNAHIENKSKSYEYLKVVRELVRVLKTQGTLLITFPFGKFEHHGFFQQLDDEMLNRILDILKDHGVYQLVFFRYKPDGWEFCDRDDCKNIVSYNPHTGKGKLDDGAAHCRSVCCIQFDKN